MRMKLRYLQLARPCTLELPLKDYAGQPLIFRSRGFLRRCVTQEVYDHDLVQRYLRQGYLTETTGKGATASKPPAAPSAAKATPAPAPPEPDPTPEPEPEPPPPTPEPEAAPESSEAAMSESASDSDSDEGESTEESKPRRRRRRKS